MPSPPCTRPSSWRGKRFSRGRKFCVPKGGENVSALSIQDIVLNEIGAALDAFWKRNSLVNTLLEITIAAAGIILLTLFSVWAWAGGAHTEVKLFLSFAAVTTFLSVLVGWLGTSSGRAIPGWIADLRHAYIKFAMEADAKQLKTESSNLLDEIHKGVQYIEKVYFRGSFRFIIFAFSLLVFSVGLLAAALVVHIWYN